LGNKTCFVVMPIRKFGTPEYAHFRAIFEQLRPTVEAFGYTVQRADDVQKSGAIMGLIRVGGQVSYVDLRSFSSSNTVQ
jgi:hypothetical protein